MRLSQVKPQKTYFHDKTHSSRPTSFLDHFLSDKHYPKGVELVPLKFIHSSQDALLKDNKAYLIERSQALEPKGMNKREKLNLIFNTLIPDVLYPISYHRLYPMLAL